MEYRNRRWAQWLIWIVIATSMIFFSTRAYYRMTDDFRVANITYDMPFHSEWEVKPLSPSDIKVVKAILNQQFNYVGKGAQSYAFLSDDKKHVIKFFKFKHLKPNWLVETIPDIALFEEYKAKKNARKKRLINSVFKGYKLAYDLHRKESGLIYIHLNKTSDLLQEITLRDKIGRKHRLNLDSTVFVLQENAQITREVIKQALDIGNLDLVKKKMHQIIDLYLLEYSKGIYDRDHGLMHNTGFVGEKPIHLDVGKLSRDRNMSNRENMVLDLEKVGIRFEDWLKINYPQYHEEVILHIQEIMSEKVGEKVDFSSK
jgi:hypothetical protein